MFKNIIELKVSLGLNPIKILWVEMEAHDVCDVSKDLSELEAWIEVEAGGSQVDPKRHVQVKEHLFNDRRLRKHNIHDHGAEDYAEVYCEGLTLLRDNRREKDGDADVRLSRVEHEEEKDPDRSLYKHIKLEPSADGNHFKCHYGVHHGSCDDPRGPVSIVLGSEHLHTKSELVTLFSHQFVENDHKDTQRHHYKIESAVHRYNI